MQTNLKIALPLGRAQEDIDGDGKKENIRFSLKDSKQKEYKQGTLTIDGRVFVIGTERYDSDIYLLDIDQKDRFREILVMSYELSDYEHIYLYRYVEKKLILVGDLSENTPNSLLLDGAGSLICKKRGEFLQTWYGRQEYYIDAKHKMKERPQKYLVMNSMLITARNLPLQQTSEDSRITITVPSGEVVLLRRCDNKQLLEIVTVNGQAGWIRTSGEPDDPVYKGIPLYDYFDNLFIAG